MNTSLPKILYVDKLSEDGAFAFTDSKQKILYNAMTLEVSRTVGNLYKLYPKNGKMFPLTAGRYLALFTVKNNTGRLFIYDPAKVESFSEINQNYLGGELKLEVEMIMDTMSLMAKNSMVDDVSLTIDSIFSN